MYRLYKYLNRVQFVVWNGNYGVINLGFLGLDEKFFMGSGFFYQFRIFGQMMDFLVMRLFFFLNQWIEQLNFLFYGVFFLGYMRLFCKFGGYRLQLFLVLAFSFFFGVFFQVLRGVQRGVFMMDSSEMIVMQQLFFRVCLLGVFYYFRQFVF